MPATPKDATLIFAAGIYSASLAALATLTGVGVVDAHTGITLVSSLVTLGVGAALALLNPAGTVPVAPAAVAAAETAARAVVADLAPGPAQAAQTSTPTAEAATAPAMP